MSDMILHHYPQSPVSEKVRIGFGIKDIAWHSVEIPRLPPKPDLMPLTGGYRRTPVMQIGADIYCDSACIMAALEQHVPEPTLFPAGPGRGWALCRWVETGLLEGAIRIVLGHAPDALPPAFAADRGRLYLGPSHDLAAVHRDLPHTIAQTTGQLAWLDQWLAQGPGYLEAERPGMADAFAYYILWFLRGRWHQGPALIDSLPALAAWETRMTAIGHGRPQEMSAHDALETASAARTRTAQQVDESDPQALSAGQLVDVEPEGDGGDPPVRGQLHRLDHHHIAVLREDARVGEVCVHFPRVGYRVTAV